MRAGSGLGGDMARTWRYRNHRALDAGIEDYRRKCSKRLPANQVTAAVDNFRHQLHNFLFCFEEDPDLVPQRYRAVLDPETDEWRVFLGNGWYVSYTRVDGNPVGEITFRYLGEVVDGLDDLLGP